MGNDSTPKNEEEIINVYLGKGINDFLSKQDKRVKLLDLKYNLIKNLKYKQDDFVFIDMLDKELGEVLDYLKSRNEKAFNTAYNSFIEGDITQAETLLADDIETEIKAIEEAEAFTEEKRKTTANKCRQRGALAFLHDTQKALDSYTQATQLDPDNMDGWNKLGHILYRVGRLDEAIEAYEKMMALAEQAEDIEASAVVIDNLGLVYQTRGDLDGAEVMYKRALELNEALGRKEGMASAYGSLGNVYQICGDLEAAEAMYRRSLELNESLGRKEGMASDYGNLGIVHQMRGDLEAAEVMYRRSLELNESLGRKEGIANQYGNLGIVYKARGDLNTAEMMHKRALELDKALGHKESIASGYGNLGTLYKARGDISKACDHWSRALALFKEVGAKPQIEKTQSLLAEANLSDS